MATKTTDIVRKSIGLPKETWERVRQFRFAAQCNTETEAIRRLIEKGLEVEGGLKNG